MFSISLEKTIADLDRQIEVAHVAYSAAQERLRYLRQARDMFVHPMAGTLPFNFEAIEEQEPVKLPRVYGSLKRGVFDAMAINQAMTTQDLVDKMNAAGYVFRSKNPIVSVNEALKSLANDGQVAQDGRTQNGYYLWTRVEGVSGPSELEEEEGSKQEPAEASS